jgi:ribulose-5-phosphate 4-epimerase/fuculose-1-phosphate aldolase
MRIFVFAASTIVSICILVAQTTAPQARTSGTELRASKDQIDELVLANRILSGEGVLDAYGHVSVRSARNPDHFFLARHIAAGTVTAADIIEYDLDSQPVHDTRMIGYSERFIHGEIYKSRPDVKAIVHGHAPEIVTFSVTQTPLRPISHMAAFLGGPVPVFDTRDVTSDGEMLIRNNELGHALAQTLGKGPAALIRGHGAVVVADSLHVVAGRAYYMNVNARELLQALLIPGSRITYIQPNEAVTMAAQDGYERAWLLWKQQLSPAYQVHQPAAGHNSGPATDK